MELQRADAEALAWWYYRHVAEAQGLGTPGLRSSRNWRRPCRMQGHGRVCRVLREREVPVSLAERGTRLQGGMSLWVFGCVARLARWRKNLRATSLSTSSSRQACTGSVKLRQGWNFMDFTHFSSWYEASRPLSSAKLQRGASQKALQLAGGPGTSG